MITKQFAKSQQSSNDLDSNQQNLDDPTDDSASAYTFILSDIDSLSNYQILCAIVDRWQEPNKIYEKFKLLYLSYISAVWGVLGAATRLRYKIRLLRLQIKTLGWSRLFF
jgi:hypothetical protein